MDVFWEQRVVPNIVKANDISEAYTILDEGALAVEVCFRWKCRYYPFHRPTKPKPSPFEYIDDRYMVWLNPGIDFIRRFSFSANVVEDICFHLDDSVYMESLKDGFPVTFFDRRVHLSAAPTMFKDGHPVLPEFHLIGVILGHSLRAEMHCIPSPTAHNFTYLVQVCNCLSLKPHNAANSIIKKNPDLGPYPGRIAGKKRIAKEECRGVPGTIHVAGDVVCFLAQWRPGIINSVYFRRYPESDPPETTEQREKWFQECLNRLADMCTGAVAIAFPDRSGCQVAGENWKHYEKMISRFAKKLPEGSRVHITKHIT